MSVGFFSESDFTSLAVDIEASDPKALMALWERAPDGTRVSQPMTRSVGIVEVTAFLVMAKKGVDLTLALIDLAKTLRGIKEKSPGLTLRLRVRYGSKVADSELGPLRTTEWEVQFERQSEATFVGDETLGAADARRRSTPHGTGDQ
ncbi:hypothetical protein [Burkholderia gladioli]|uniref:hypothetical protein n=1 Tax=Burkholderia gladioli TaxID=28095 RepID=UPI001640664F|nr:hypothetical protein [Burkholderia gladioli]